MELMREHEEASMELKHTHTRAHTHTHRRRHQWSSSINDPSALMNEAMNEPDPCQEVPKPDPSQGSV